MKIRIFAGVTIISVISLLLFNQCGKYKVIPEVCFNKNILPIFISKCTTSGCHSGGSGRHEGKDYTNYEGIMRSVNAGHPLMSEAYTQCTGNNPSMPPRGYPALTKTELEYIKYWIHTGAKYSADCSAGSCDTTNFSFSGRIQPLLNSWCVGCHNPSNPGGGYDLSTYDGVVNSIAPSNRLEGSIVQLAGFSAMPKGSSKIDDCDIKAVQKWIAAGNPNN